MTRLQPLQSRLNDLRRQRWLARMAIGASGLAVAAMWSLATLFLVDWLLEMNRLPRLILILTAAATVVYAFVRLTKPWLMNRESLIDMALLVERQQQLDNDLVAALQFESSDAVRWGSRQLQTAVVEYVADFSRELDVFAGISFAPLRSRLTTLGVTLGAIAIGAALSPSHLSVFGNRLLLGGAHYPTKTRIEQIAINGQIVFPHSLGGEESSSLTPIRIPYGRPMRVEVACSGKLPTGGMVKLTNPDSGLATQFELKPRAGDEASAREPTSSTVVFAGELSRLTDAVTYQIFIGDAWTDPARIELVPLPVVNLELLPTPPAYAVNSATPPKPTTNSRQLNVLEGSKLDVRLTCLNKPLRTVTAAVQHGPTIELVASDVGRKAWSLPEIAADDENPFSRVTSLLAFEVQATDDDGLQLERPLVAVVRIQEDRPPKVAAAVVTDRVLPTARPSVTFGATDDFGVAAIRLHCDIHHGMAELRRQSFDVIPPGTEPKLILRGRHTLDLRPLGVAKGDEVHVTLEAIDFRGANTGQSAHSEPIVLRVTDESGVLAGLAEADERSARQLDVIIQRQLGIGEAK